MFETPPCRAQIQSNSPLLWSDAELEAYLTGSPILAETRTRIVQLKGQWQALQDNWFSKDPARYPPGNSGVSGDCGMLGVL